MAFETRTFDVQSHPQIGHFEKKNSEGPKEATQAITGQRGLFHIQAWGGRIENPKPGQGRGTMCKGIV